MAAAKKAVAKKATKKEKKDEDTELEDKPLGADLEEEEEEVESDEETEGDEEENEEVEDNGSVDEDPKAKKARYELGELDKAGIRVQELEVAGKKVYFPLYFILRNKKGDKVAGFNEHGQRISPWMGVNDQATEKGDPMPAKKIAKDVARSNALRRQKMLPEDFARQVPVNGVIVSE